MLCMCQRLSSFYMPFWFDDKTIVHCVRQFDKIVMLYVCMSVCLSFLSSYCKEGTMMFLHKNQRSQVRRFILLSKYFIIRKGVVALFFFTPFTNGNALSLMKYIYIFHSVTPRYQRIRLPYSL